MLLPHHIKTAVVAFAALVACGTTDEMEPTYGDGPNRIENGVWDTAMSVDTTRATFSGVAEGR